MAFSFSMNCHSLRGQQSFHLLQLNHETFWKHLSLVRLRWGKQNSIADCVCTMPPFLASHPLLGPGPSLPLGEHPPSFWGLLIFVHALPYPGFLFPPFTSSQNLNFFLGQTERYVLRCICFSCKTNNLHSLLESLWYLVCISAQAQPLLSAWTRWLLTSPYRTGGLFRPVAPP